MSRVKVASFSRSYEFDRESVPESQSSKDCPDWLNQFARDRAKKESQTAVDVSRERGRSIYQQMSAIVGGISNTPKFSSVDEVVQDYQNRTGLTEYLKKVHSEDLNDVAKQVLAASKDDTKKKL